MRATTKALITMLVLLGGFAMAQGALAEPIPVPLAGLESVWEAPVIGEALSSQDLEGLNGREGVKIDIKDVNAIFSNTDQKGYLGENFIGATNSSFTTGGNSIDGGAFTNMNGIATVIQNSGNQVLIQNATVVDVIVK